MKPSGAAEAVSWCALELEELDFDRGAGSCASELHQTLEAQKTSASLQCRIQSPFR
jgi:hypothetical protein